LGLGTAPALTLHFPQSDSNARDLTAAAIDGTGATAILDRDPREWRVFYPSREARDAARAALGPFCGDRGIEIGEIDVEDEDWALRTQAQLTAVRVGNIIVAPPWDVPAKPRPAKAGHYTDDQGDEAIIVIEPSVGFGTGHHASTRLCLRALQTLPVRGRSVLDVGAGSGVLAIAAARLGAARVTAIDTDADAVGNARENADRNGVAIDFRVADGSGFTGRFDVVLANLTAAWLRRLATPLASLGSPQGTLVLSGLQTHEQGSVRSAFPLAFETIAALDEEGWTALVLRISR
jgi:ribosomal protein L11 methyltransferase